MNFEESIELLNRKLPKRWKSIVRIDVGAPSVVQVGVWRPMNWPKPYPLALACSVIRWFGAGLGQAEDAVRVAVDFAHSAELEAADEAAAVRVEPIAEPIRKDWFFAEGNTVIGKGAFDARR